MSPALYRALERGLSADPGDRFESMSRWRQCLLDAVSTDATWRPGPANGTRLPVAESGEVGTIEAGIDGVGPRPFRQWWVAFGLAGLATLIVLGWLATRLVVSDGIVGPEEVVVGEAARYRPPAHRDEPVLWIGPNGEQVRDEDLEVRAVVPGRLRIELVADGARASRVIRAVPSPLGPRIEGPTEARVDETIVLRSSSTEHDRAHYWLDPRGARVDEEWLELRPTTPGRLSVTLVARGDDGIERGARHEVEVRS